MFKLEQGKSISGWESSKFGGYSSVLYDYPFIYVSNSLYTEPSSRLTKDLYYYQANKLLSLFLLKVNENGLTGALMQDAKVIYVKAKFPWQKNKTEYHLNKNTIRNITDVLVKSEAELSSMFAEFAQGISESTIKIVIYEEDTDGEEEEKGEGKEGKPIPKQRKQEILDILEETQKRERKISGNSLNSFVNLKPKFKSVTKNAVKTQYTSRQKTDSDNLAKMLDITFDMDKDVIKSLRAGKLDPNKLCEILSANPNIYEKVEENQKTRPFSVAILCDESGSMGREGIGQQHDLVKILYRAFSQFIPQERMYIYGHTGEYSPHVHIYHDPYNQDFEHKIDSMLRVNLAQNYDGPVIEKIYETIRSNTDDNILFIVISDGYPEGYDYGGPRAVSELKRVLEKCRRDGFVTVGIGFHDYDGVKKLYNYSIQVDGDNIPERVSRLINNVVKTEFQT